MHKETLVLGHNNLNFTFGGFAQASWAGSGFATGATGDFLFRLAPGAIMAYHHSTGGDDHYQILKPTRWPTWGDHAELYFGYKQSLGYNGRCASGTTYGAKVNEVCGGAQGSWGATQMEVWYRVF